MSASSTTRRGNSSASDDSVLPNASRRESPLAMRAGLDIEQFLHLGLVAAQRGQRLFHLFAGQLHAAMPGRDILHEGNALALDGVGDDDRGPAEGCGDAAERL